MEIIPLSAKDLVKDPYGSYVQLYERLTTLGPNAPFPEFKPVIDFLLEKLNSEKFTTILADHLDLNFELKEVKSLFTHINLQFIFDDEALYPYSRPFIAPFPYRPTIDAIEAALRLLDKLNRLEPGNKAVPLYHFDRYAYHRHSLIADPNVILFPTIQDLDFFDLIRIRSVPIGFIGVFAETLRVDRHWQSPLDFWYHDINHVRRMYEYIRRSMKDKEILTPQESFRFFKEMDNFISETILPQIIEPNTDASEEQVALCRLIRTIMFEIFHETALTAEKESIINDILRESGPQPFEHMVKSGGQKPTDVEKLRTPTGNLESGASVVQNNNNEAITIRYFFDRSLGLLSNIYNKLNFGFYDDPDSPNELIVPTKFRTPEYLMQAAKEVFIFLGAQDRIPSDEKLMELILAREGAEEKFVYKGLANKDDKDKQYATDPISADDVIVEIKKLGKRVHTLFGYSLLEYENKPSVLEKIRKELESLDNRTTLINIGATSEGIGEAYKIAKELGFETTGIVSTQALFYSGKFSDYVDRIYIVNDMNWGGYVPGTMNLAEATKAFLGASDAISAFGGGENTAAILKLAKEYNIPVSFTPARMDPKIAAEVYGNKEIDLDGPANTMWLKLQS